MQDTKEMEAGRCTYENKCIYFYHLWDGLAWVLIWQCVTVAYGKTVLAAFKLVVFGGNDTPEQCCNKVNLVKEITWQQKWFHLLLLSDRWGVILITWQALSFWEYAVWKLTKPMKIEQHYNVTYPGRTQFQLNIPSENHPKLQHLQSFYTEPLELFQPTSTSFWSNMSVTQNTDYYLKDRKAKTNKNPFRNLMNKKLTCCIKLL